MDLAESRVSNNKAEAYSIIIIGTVTIIIIINCAK